MTTKSFHIILFFFISISTIGQTITRNEKDINLKFIDNAEKISIKLWDSIFTKDLVCKSIKLSKSKSLVRDDFHHTYSSLIDYKGEFKPTSVFLSYDFLYKTDTFLTKELKIDYSLQITNLEDYLVLDIPYLIGVKYILQDKFKFNYERLKKAIKTNPEIDTNYNEISIAYSTVYNYKIVNKKTFVETSYYWSIGVFKRINDFKNSENYLKFYREFKIDTETGKVIKDKPKLRVYPRTINYS